MGIRDFLYNSSIFEDIKIQKIRDEWVIEKLNLLSDDSMLLDAGCGSQRYRKYCQRMQYFGQDIAEYTTDTKVTIEKSIGDNLGYSFGPLDYVCSFDNIPVKDNTFDAILCTEVFEHSLNPQLAIPEFYRILKPGGQLILTVPRTTIRHMDPYYYYSGFSDNWLNMQLKENKFVIKELSPVSDYYRVVALELARIMSSHNIFSKLFLSLPFLYLMSLPKTKISVSTQCYGYHVCAEKLK